MLNGFLKFLNILLFVVGIPLAISVVVLPPALLSFFMGWPYYVFECVAALWVFVLISWGAAVAYYKGWIR